MAKPKEKNQYREGTLGWWLMQAGWEPVEVNCVAGIEHKRDQHGRCEKCGQVPHPLWRFDGFDKTLTGWQAWRLELLRIHHEFEAKKSSQNCR